MVQPMMTTVQQPMMQSIQYAPMSYGAPVQYGAPMQYGAPVQYGQPGFPGGSVGVRPA
eukprot:CAMPEP_0204392718 /NCGR_PEP_ID=MMETSP0469-20131031/61903_1 /ASSEMBLY_ACC=CAM_ASM_000384 /TAXON_ID=2969 /ORGANISM="Oxyrrhis marina" /LENGTH=57 /DNA_ID=CAMNT_0051386711 /DNA_START=24 /DNA_END=197 /DNA_ORIENTATION=+